MVYWCRRKYQVWLLHCLSVQSQIGAEVVDSLITSLPVILRPTYFIKDGALGPKSCKYAMFGQACCFVSVAIETSGAKHSSSFAVNTYSVEWTSCSL